MGDVGGESPTSNFSLDEVEMEWVWSVPVVPVVMVVVCVGAVVVTCRERCLVLSERYVAVSGERAVGAANSARSSWCVCVCVCVLRGRDTGGAIIRAVQGRCIIYVCV